MASQSQTYILHWDSFHQLESTFYYCIFNTTTQPTRCCSQHDGPCLPLTISCLNMLMELCLRWRETGSRAEAAEGWGGGRGGRGGGDRKTTRIYPADEYSIHTDKSCRFVLKQCVGLLPSPPANSFYPSLMWFYDSHRNTHTQMLQGWLFGATVLIYFLLCWGRLFVAL